MTSCSASFNPVQQCRHGCRFLMMTRPQPLLLQLQLQQHLVVGGSWVHAMGYVQLSWTLAVTFASVVSCDNRVNTCKQKLVTASRLKNGFVCLKCSHLTLIHRQESSLQSAHVCAKCTMDKRSKRAPLGFHPFGVYNSYCMMLFQIFHFNQCPFFFFLLHKLKCLVSLHWGLDNPHHKCVSVELLILSVPLRTPGAMVTLMGTKKLQGYYPWLIQQHTHLIACAVRKSGAITGLSILKVTGRIRFACSWARLSEIVKKPITLSYINSSGEAHLVASVETK